MRFDTAMTALTRRRDDEANAESWLIYCEALSYGTTVIVIGIGTSLRSLKPVTTPLMTPSGWFAGTVPSKNHPKASAVVRRNGTPATFTPSTFDENQCETKCFIRSDRWNVKASVERSKYGFG